MDENRYKVFAKTDESGRIIDINSSAFIDDLEGWTEIDEGCEFRHLHAQRNYLPKRLMDDRGIYQFAIVDGAVVERTQEEMDADFAQMEPAVDLVAEVAALKQENAYLKEAMELILSGATEE